MSPGNRVRQAGRRLPDEAAWLRCVAFPEPAPALLRGQEVSKLSAECCEAARRGVIECRGPVEAGDLGLRRCVSSQPTEIGLWGSGASPACLDFVGECPQLRRVEFKFGALSSKSLTALLNRPGIEQVEIDSDAEELSLLGGLAGGSRLQLLAVDLQDARPLPRFVSSPAAPTADLAAWSPPRASGDFVWLKGRQRLRELTFSTLTRSHTTPAGETLSHDPALIQAVGRHLRGVEKLNIGACRPEIVEALAEWTRLRHH